MLDAGDQFLAANWKLGDTKCFLFYTFYNLIWFWQMKIPCREYLMPFPGTDFNAFLLTRVGGYTLFKSKKHASPDNTQLVSMKGVFVQT